MAIPPSPMQSGIDGTTTVVGTVVTALFSALGYVGKRYLASIEADRDGWKTRAEGYEKVINAGYADLRSQLAEAKVEKDGLWDEVRALQRQLDAALSAATGDRSDRV